MSDRTGLVDSLAIDLRFSVARVRMLLRDDSLDTELTDALQRALDAMVELHGVLNP